MNHVLVFCTIIHMKSNELDADKQGIRFLCEILARRHPLQYLASVCLCLFIIFSLLQIY